MAIGTILQRCAMVAALLLLTGCQPPGYVIHVVPSNGVVTFEARGRDDFFNDFPDDQIEAHTLRVTSNGKPIWEIRRLEDPRCHPTTPMPTFPINYGRQPDCYETPTPPRRLEAGRIYKVEGEGLQDGSGYFRLSVRVDTLTWEQVPDEAK